MPRLPHCTSHCWRRRAQHRRVLPPLSPMPTSFSSFFALLVLIPGVLIPLHVIGRMHHQRIDARNVGDRMLTRGTMVVMVALMVFSVYAAYAVYTSLNAIASKDASLEDPIAPREAVLCWGRLSDHSPLAASSAAACRAGSTTFVSISALRFVVYV